MSTKIGNLKRIIEIAKASGVSYSHTRFVSGCSVIMFDKEFPIIRIWLTKKETFELLRKKKE